MDITNHMMPWEQQYAPLQPLLGAADAYWFDLDGTLVDNEGPALDLIRDIISNHIQQVSPGHEGIKSCYRHYSGKKPQDIITIAEHESQVELSANVREKILNDITVERRIAFSQLTSADPILPLAAMAKFLKDNGKPVCIVTASEPERAEKYIRVSGLDTVFSGPADEWLFASNLKSKIEAHERAQQTLSRIHGIDIKPERWLGFEDSPSALEQGIQAGAIVIPHILCGHIASEHVDARALLLQSTSRKARENSPAVVHSGNFVRLHDHDMPIIRNPEDIVPVMQHVLGGLPERPLPRRSAPLIGVGNGSGA